MCLDCLRLNRRHFLTQSAAGLAATGLYAASGGFSPAHAAEEGTAVTPDEALERLKQGNAKFVDAPELCGTRLQKQRAKVAHGQAPWATVLSCADSRVPPELIFGGLTLGKLFVCRNAGNTADIATMGTIEYGALKLGSPLILVLAHQRCGAVTAACEVAEKGTQLPGDIGPMVEPIVPAAKAMLGKPGDFIENTARESARRTAEHIAGESEIIKPLVQQGKLKIVHGIYELDTGRVEFLD